MCLAHASDSPRVGLILATSPGGSRPEGPARAQRARGQVWLRRGFFGGLDTIIDRNGPGRFCKKHLIEPTLKWPCRRGNPAPRAGSDHRIHTQRESVSSERPVGDPIRSTHIRPTVPRSPSSDLAHSDSISSRNHARDPRAVTSGRLGEEEGTPAGAPSGPAPVLVVCSICRQPIHYNETLRISFCPIHGLSEPFTFIPLGQKPPREA